MKNDHFNSHKQDEILNVVSMKDIATNSYIFGCNKVYYVYANYGLLHLLSDECEIHPSCKLSSEKFEYRYQKLRKYYANIILEKNHNAKCCYCLVSDAEQIDHYLTKSQYPSYSIVYNNLVPACYSCNHTKHDKSPQNEIWFIQPNFEEIPPDFFLQVNFNNDYNRLVFAMPWISKTSKNFILMKKIEFTFTELKIFDKYAKKAHEELIIIIREFINPLNINTNFHNFLRLKYDNSCQEPNALWKRSLYRFLKDNQYFIDIGYKIYAQNYGITFNKI